MLTEEQRSVLKNEELNYLKWQSYKVKGNIYQNPELAENEK